MSRLLSSSAAAALFIGAGTLPALAQVTADQVWDNWQTLGATSGAAITSQESRQGNVLTVTDVVSRFSEDDMTVVTTVPFLTFTENADGSVSVAMAPTSTLELRDSRGQFNMLVEVSQPDLSIGIAGTPDAMRYEFTSSELRAEVVEFRAPNPGTGPDATLDMTATVRDMSGSYQVTAGNVLGISSDSAIGSMELMVDLVAPSGMGYLRANVSTGAVESTADVANMQLLSPEIDPLVAFAQGLSFLVNVGYADLAMDFDFEDSGDVAQGSYTAESAELDFELSQDRLRYIIAMGATRASAIIPDVPIPFESGFAEARIGVDIPLTTGSAGAQDGSAVLRVVDLTVGEPVFAMFDPGQVIPRTPATVIFDATMRGVVNIAQAASGAEDFPGILESLSLNEIRVAFGGADVNATGAFTFDMADTSTFDGMPAPIGQINAQATGLNGLLDRIGQLGVMGAEELMGTRMMIGMFGRPVGPDQIESTIEFTAGGGVAVNGMRMQ